MNKRQKEIISDCIKSLDSDIQEQFLIKLTELALNSHMDKPRAILKMEGFLRDDLDLKPEDFL